MAYLIAFKFALLCFGLREVNARSLHNSTIDMNNYVTLDAFEGLRKNFTDMFAEVAAKQATSKDDRVYFYARMPIVGVQYNKNSIVKFSFVIFNEGNHFNPGDSIFIAPVSGVYLLSWAVQGHNSRYSVTQLMIDNVRMEALHTSVGGNGGYFPFTRTIICPVRKGSHMWIETDNANTEHFFDSTDLTSSSFMGVLLFKD